MSLPVSLEFAMSEGRWQAVRGRFAEKGVDVPDEASGEISEHGVKVRFTWDGWTLRLTIVDKPFYLRESRVVDGLTEFITAA